MPVTLYLLIWSVKEKRLHAGLLNGLLLRTEVDKVTGQLSDTRTRFLGVRRPKLTAVPVRGKRSMLTLSNRPWLVRAHQYMCCVFLELTPLHLGQAGHNCVEFGCRVLAGLFRHGAIHAPTSIL